MVVDYALVVEQVGYICVSMYIMYLLYRSSTTLDPSLIAAIKNSTTAAGPTPDNHRGVTLGGEK